MRPTCQLRQGRCADAALEWNDEGDEGNVVTTIAFPCCRVMTTARHMALNPKYVTGWTKPEQGHDWSQMLACGGRC